MEIKGKFNTAIVFAEIFDDFAIGQITELCCQEAFAGAKIRIMPDVHAGAGCTIGTTMTVTDRLVPNLVGVDIGCGMLAANVTGYMDWEKLDSVIRAKVPCGFYVHDNGQKLPELDRLRCHDHVDINRAQKSIGTLGGGNHFIEVERKDDGSFMLVVHTGSRNLGKQAAEYYQGLAVQECATGFADRNELVETIKKKYAAAPAMIGEAIRQMDKAAKHYKARNLAYLDKTRGRGYGDYLNDMEIIQRFAAANRSAIAQTIINGMGWSAGENFETIHNYIDMEDMILRKGAVSAKAGQKLLIPMNMRDGSLICIGKGCSEWNFSAPHGAGRIMSRAQARARCSLQSFQESMGEVWTSTANIETIDECPQAYKPVSAITNCIGDTVDTAGRGIPAYNFKAAEEPFFGRKIKKQGEPLGEKCPRHNAV